MRFNGRNFNTQYEKKSLNIKKLIEKKNMDNFEGYENIDYNNQDKSNANKIAESKKGFSNTNYSDIDNVRINNMRYITQQAQNVFRDNGKSEYYILFCEYCKGKKISEIIDANGNFKKISDDEFNKLYAKCFPSKIKYTKRYNKSNGMQYLVPEPVDDKIIKEYNNLILGVETDLDQMSYDLKNLEIQEIVSAESGYDGIVLKDSKGNYVLTSSCTNDTSFDDIAAIVYPMSKYVFGDDQYITAFFNAILSDPSLKSTLSESFIELGMTDKEFCLEYCKKCYEGQINDCADLMQKYATIAQREGKDFGVFGYSLGGGITEAAYSKICNDNPNAEKNISSVTVYNPFNLYCQESKYGIDNIKNNKKVLMYSAQEDMVTSFNDSMYELKDRLVMVPADRLEEGTITSLSGIAGIVYNDAGNHSIGSIDKSAFDKNGNLVKPGQFININETLSTINGNGYKTGNSKSIILSDVSTDNSINTGKVHSYLEQKKLYELDKSELAKNLFNLANFDIKSKPIEIQPLLENLTKYLTKNFGNYDYDELIDIIGDGLWEIVKEEKVVAFIPLEWVTNKDVFKNVIKEYTKDTKVRDSIIDMIFNYTNSTFKKEDVYFCLDNLKPSLNAAIKSSINRQLLELEPDSFWSYFDVVEDFTRSKYAIYSSLLDDEKKLNWVSEKVISKIKEKI